MSSPAPRAALLAAASVLLLALPSAGCGDEDQPALASLAEDEQALENAAVILGTEPGEETELEGQGRAMGEGLGFLAVNASSGIDVVARFGEDPDDAARVAGEIVGAMQVSFVVGDVADTLDGEDRAFLQDLEAGYEDTVPDASIRPAPANRLFIDLAGDLTEKLAFDGDDGLIEAFRQGFLEGEETASSG